MELFLIYSDYLLAENTLTSTRCKRDNVISNAPPPMLSPVIFLHIIKLFSVAKLLQKV